MNPGNTRMVVYVGKVMAPSFAHHVARYKSNLLLPPALVGGPSPDAGAQEESCRGEEVGEHVTDVKTVMPPVVHIRSSPLAKRVLGRRPRGAGHTNCVIIFSYALYFVNSFSYMKLNCVK